MEHTKKPNKIGEIVRLQQMVKKWKKLANAPKPNTNSMDTTTTTFSKSSSITNLNASTSKSIKFLKKTLSFSDRDHSSSSNSSTHDMVPKGYVAVCVGKELKRYIIPTEYLCHQAFGNLLREAEEEFGFQQEGVLKIPCDVLLFDKIVKVVQADKRQVFFMHDPSDCFVNDDLMSSSSIGCYELTPTPHHSQFCR